MRAWAVMVGGGYNIRPETFTRISYDCVFEAAN